MTLSGNKTLWSSHRLTVALVVLDGLALSALWMLAWQLRALANPWFSAPINHSSNYLAPLPGLVIGWLATLAVYGHYAHRDRINSLNQVSRIFQATLWMLWITVILSYFLFRHREFGRSVVLLSPLLFFAYLYGSRTALRMLKIGALRRGQDGRRALIVGITPLAWRVAEHLARHPEIGFQVVGFVRSRPENADTDERAALHAVGALEDLGRLIAQAQADDVFFSDPALPMDVILNTVVRCEDRGTEFKIVSDNFFTVLTGDAILEAVDGIPVTRVGSGRLGPGEAAVKRTLDLAVAIGLAPLWAPLALIIALAIWLDDGGPVLFRQQRVGLGGTIFPLYKFRTMRRDTDPYAAAPSDPADRRITRLGRFLRKTSLDEIPQFWNVLRGHMSMVGPRPEMPFLVERYADWQRARLDVKPGITGLWQVVGRKNLPLEFNIEYDLWYLRNRTLMLDVAILFKTIPAVLFGKGAF